MLRETVTPSGGAGLAAGHPGMRYARYGSGKFLAEFLTGGFSALVFKFYETEIGLSAGLVAAAVIVYSVWNAVNDPLIGYFTARPTRFAERLGRRYPWILAGSLSCCIAFLFVFAPPGGGSTAFRFLWLLVSICLYDTLYSAWELNYQSVFPDRFRTSAERDGAARAGTLIGVFGIAAGAMLPTFIVKYGNPGSYLFNAAAFCLLGGAVVLFMRAGVRETPDMIRRYLVQERSRARPPAFFRQLSQALRTRNFLAFILLYFFYQSAAVSMTASIHYVGDYILGRSTTLVFAGMLTGALAAVPLWTGIGKAVRSNQTRLALAGAALSILCLPLAAMNDLYGFTAAMFFWGLAFGGFWLTMTPAFADIVDEIVLATGVRDDGVYLGFRAFAGRLAFAVQALSFWAAHALTGFARDPRSPEAVLGIRIHTAVVPAVLVAIGVAVFVALNRMDEHAADLNRKRLRERGL